MDVREKLVEILTNAGMGKYERQYIADILIAHGVTVQEWISVDDRLPEKNTDVLIYNIEEYIGSDFLTKYGKWFWNEELPPTHWMPLPEPPKGE